MTLYSLANQITIQGDIRISKFDEDANEIILMNVENTGDLSGELPEEYEDLTVEYIFNGEDGIHIEVSEVSDED